jgi:flagellar biogenesis protein FliO
MNHFRSLLVLLGCTATVALSAGSDPSSQGVAAPPSKIDASHSDTTSDSGIDAKLAAAQAAWDKGSASAPSAGSPVSGSSLGGLLLQLFSGLAVLVLSMFALLFLVQRARAKKNAAAGTGAGMIDLLESKSVGPSRQVTLIRLHNRVVAVAFNGPSATLLSEFGGTDAAEIIAESGNGRTSIRDFSATLDTLMDRFRARPGEKPSGSEAPR